MSELVVMSKEDLRALITAAVREAISGAPSVEPRPTTEGWLKVGAAAAILNKSRGTIYRWLVDGVIPESARLPVGNTFLISAKWCAGSRTAAAA